MWGGLIVGTVKEEVSSERGATELFGCLAKTNFEALFLLH